MAEATQAETTKARKLTKTMTFGLGKPYAFDLKTASLVELTDDQRKLYYTELSTGFRTFARICNYTTSLFYAARILKANIEDWDYNKGYRPILDKLGIEMHLCGDILSQTFGVTKAHFSGEHGKRLMGSGETVLPLHKADGTHPIYFHKNASRIFKRDDHYWIALHVFAAEWSKSANMPAWIALPIKIKPRDKTAAGQLDRLIGGEWDAKNSRMLKNRRDVGSKYLIQIMVGYEPDPFKQLSPTTIMGIDRGVIAPATIHVRENGKAQGWAQRVGDGRAMKNARGVLQAEIKRLVRALRTKNSPLLGPARAAAMDRLTILRKRERRVMKTASQRVAAQIAEIARRNGAGTWQVEELSKGIKSDSWLARNWAPGLVLDAIRWQAQQLGAELKFVNPAYTSQRCSKCGHIDALNRPKGSKGASYFKCASCGHEDDADKNAARNLSIDEIDRIIESTMPVEREEPGSSDGKRRKTKGSRRRMAQAGEERPKQPESSAGLLARPTGRNGPSESDSDPEAFR